MTGSGVERMPRTAYPMPSVPPAGISTLMPPHIQGAERRMESRTRRTRWGLRVLVVGGLAGAAWLLTGSAAHAAERADGPTGPLLGSVVGGDATTPVTGLLMAAAQPLEAVTPAHEHHVVASVLDVPRRVLTRPAETLAEVTHGNIGTPVDIALSTVDLALREVAGPIRLTGGPTITSQLLTRATEPATRSHRPVVDRSPATAPAHEVSPALPDAVVVSRAPISKVLQPPVTARTVSVSTGQGKTTSYAHRHRATVPAELTGTTLGGYGPAAPMQPHLGDVSGSPTSGSGTPTEGGSPAFLPAAIVDSTMACQLLPVATDVDARRYDAEAPTVSPD